MDVTHYLSWKQAGYPGLVARSEADRRAAIGIIERAYADQARAAQKGMGMARKPFSGRLHTMPMGSATAKQGRTPAQRRARFAQQLEQAVRRGFALAGWCCNDCGGAVGEQDLVRVCSACASEET